MRGLLGAGGGGRTRTNFNPLPSYEGRLYIKGVCGGDGYFNPLPSCEGRHGVPAHRVLYILFQSTPLTRGETRYSFSVKSLGDLFQSTPLMRGETNSNTRDVIDNQFQSTPLMRGETFRFPNRPQSA